MWAEESASAGSAQHIVGEIPFSTNRIEPSNWLKALCKSDKVEKPEQSGLAHCKERAAEHGQVKRSQRKIIFPFQFSGRRLFTQDMVK